MCCKSLRLSSGSVSRRKHAQQKFEEIWQLEVVTVETVESTLAQREAASMRYRYKYLCTHQLTVLALSRSSRMLYRCFDERIAIRLQHNPSIATSASVTATAPCAVVLISSYSFHAASFYLVAVSGTVPADVTDYMRLLLTLSTHRCHCCL
eukprot:3001-Heterococcus_DN1.PRE.2